MANTAQATQKFVPVREVRDGIAILRDGSMKAVLMTSSANFALKSQDEQIAILAQFQAFLNTLDFSLQIYVQSRRLNIKPYIELLATREEGQDNDLMRVQLREYMGFIEKFTKEVDIMTKSFFVVISYSPATIDVKKGIGNIGKFIKKEKRESKEELDLAHFQEYRSQIEQRIASVEQGLNRVGVRTIALGTDEVVDLFYHLFNPTETNKASGF